MADIPFQKDMTFQYGVLEPVTHLVRRIVAHNPGPYTFHGTATFVLGQGKVAVIDPGPEDAAHIEALLDALGAEAVSHILVTHTHADHSPGAALLKQKTGAPTFAFGPHGAGRVAQADVPLERGDLDFVPDERVGDGDLIEGEGWTVECVHTPGHASNHLAFALTEERTLFCGDAVMAWSTAVISPPDGHLASYLATLDKMKARDDLIYRPTHGPSIEKPQDFVQAYVDHRAARERQLVECLTQGPQTVRQIVDRIYKDVDPRVLGAAGQSVRAHLDHLIEKGAAAKTGAENETFCLIEPGPSNT